MSIAVERRRDTQVRTYEALGPEGTKKAFVFYAANTFPGQTEELKDNSHFNNYGGEERFWLGPEGGQFSLWFAPGAKQDLDHWLTPPALKVPLWQTMMRIPAFKSLRSSASSQTIVTGGSFSPPTNMNVG